MLFFFFAFQKCDGFVSWWKLRRKERRCGEKREEKPESSLTFKDIRVVWQVHWCHFWGMFFVRFDLLYFVVLWRGLLSFVIVLRCCGCLPVVTVPSFLPVQLGSDSGCVDGTNEVGDVDKMLPSCFIHWPNVPAIGCHDCTVFIHEELQCLCRKKLLFLAPARLCLMAQTC